MQVSRFLYVLILGLAASLADSATDFNFTWSVPEACGGSSTTECSVQYFDLAQVSSPCGMFHYKKLERVSYTFIAFPGFFLGYSGIKSLVVALVSKCCKGEFHKIVIWLVNALVAALKFSLMVGLFLGARSNSWPCSLPHLVPVYDCAIQGMAYLSAALIVGVKCLGTFCHGPQSCHLVFRAKEAETKFEAALQLALISRIHLSSGVRTSASLLSAFSSIFFIGNNGVQNFLQRHEEKLSEASTPGKICVAASVLPIFLLTTIFKIGVSATNRVWNTTAEMVTIFLSLGLPISVILLLKMCNLLKDLEHVNQRVISDIMSLHLWPKGEDGKRISLAMTTFTFLLFASPSPFLVASPAPTTDWVTNNTAGYNMNNAGYNTWASETGDRLQIASICFLLIGSIAFALAICLILFEDKWVDKIVSKFPNHVEEEEEGPHPAGEVEMDLKNITSFNAREDGDIPIMKKDRDASDLICDEGNIDSEIQKEYKLASLEDALVHLGKQNNL